MRPEEVGKPIIPETQPLPRLEVPAVIDRPFEADSGPHVIVERFRLLDARDRPDLQVSVAELEVLLQGLKQAKPEGFTIGQLEDVAAQVTGYYRERGLILAQAVVPVQTVQSGIVDIQVYEGKLGRILVEGNDSYSYAKLRQPFKNLIGKPVVKDEIESVLLTLTDYPGLSVFGVFQPGQQVGTADIVLRVQEEKNYNISYRADNHGLQSTGRARFRPVIAWNNPTGGADRITATIQQTYRPKNNIFYAVDYERRMPYGITFAANWNRNAFDVGGELKSQEISGLTRELGFSLEKQWLRNRQMNLSTNVSLAHKESQTFLRGDISNRDILAVLGVGVNFDNVDIRFKGINFATLEYSHGFNDLLGAMGTNNDAQQLTNDRRPGRRGNKTVNGAYAAGQFTKIFATAMRLQTLKYGFNLLARMEYQWSNSLLVPLEQYAVGGPDNVRAYPQTQQLLDRALFGSVEFIHPVPFIADKEAFSNRTWGELLTLSAFYDHAIGRLNKPISTEPQAYVNFKGAGFQAQFILQGVLESRLMVAWPFDGSFPPANGRRPQLWGDITYRF